MKKRRIVTTLFCVIVLALLFTGVALAEYKSVGDTNGQTYAGDPEVYYAYTSADYTMYNLYVNERAWGSPPNPLKDEQPVNVFYTTNTGTVHVSDIYYNAKTLHYSQIYPSGPTTTFYTSDSGCTSSYCWWANAGSCSYTC